MKESRQPIVEAVQRMQDCIVNHLDQTLSLEQLAGCLRWMAGLAGCRYMAPNTWLQAKSRKSVLPFMPSSP